MKHRILIGLMASILAQPMFGLEMVRTLIPEQITTEVIAFNDLEKAQEILGRCSTEERQEVARLLKGSLLQWVVQHGAPEMYAARQDKERADMWIMAGCTGFFAALTALIAGKLVYNIIQASTLADQAVSDYYELHRVTNTSFLGKSGKVDGVPLTSPWFVDGEELDALGNNVAMVSKSFEAIFQAAGGVSGGTLFTLLLGISAKDSYTNCHNNQEELDRFAYMAKLVVYLEPVQG